MYKILFSIVLLLPLSAYALIGTFDEKLEAGQEIFYDRGTEIVKSKKKFGVILVLNPIDSPYVYSNFKIVVFNLSEKNINFGPENISITSDKMTFEIEPVERIIQRANNGLSRKIQAARTQVAIPGLLAGLGDAISGYGNGNNNYNNSNQVEANQQRQRENLESNVQASIQNQNSSNEEFKNSYISKNTIFPSKNYESIASFTYPSAKYKKPVPMVIKVLLPDEEHVFHVTFSK